MSEEQKIRAGILFSPLDDTLCAMKLKAHNLSTAYNQSFEDETDKRTAILRELFGALGEGSFLQGPIYIHYGCHTHIGKAFFGNFNLTIQDDADVYIGDHCSFGPNVTLVTPLHPLLPNERASLRTATGELKHMCYAKPIHIGDHCWFGANVTVCPGVTIGDNCVIGAGSVVTRDIPSNSIAIGIPCRVTRHISTADSMANFPEILADNTLP